MHSRSYCKLCQCITCNNFLNTKEYKNDLTNNQLKSFMFNKFFATGMTNYHEMSNRQMFYFQIIHFSFLVILNYYYYIYIQIRQKFSWVRADLLCFLVPWQDSCKTRLCVKRNTRDPEIIAKEEICLRYVFNANLMKCICWKIFCIEHDSVTDLLYTKYQCN